MIIFRQKVPFPEEMKNLLYENEFKQKYYDSDRSIATTFSKGIDYKNLGETSREYYSNLIESLVRVLGIYDNVEYSWHYWYQVYDKESKGHEPHLHFSGKEILSWVHFISVSNTQSFYFKTGDGDRKVLEENDELLVFPSWCIHGVEKFQSDDTRIVAAGNISLEFLNDPTGENNLGYDENVNGYIVNPTISLVKNERFENK